MSTRSRLAATRRLVLRGVPALAGLWAAGARAAADLKGKTVVFASWGGAYQDAERACYCDPFAAATGARVVQDGPMNIAKFRAMVEGGTPDWDVADVTIDFLYAGSADGLFERIDTAAVDTSRIDPRFVHENGVGCIVWSFNLAYSTTAFPAGEQPRTWADLFDLKRFPGKRTLGDEPRRCLRSRCWPMGCCRTSCTRSTWTARSASSTPSGGTRSSGPPTRSRSSCSSMARWALA